MDEPCSALDPIATRAIEDLMHELKKRLHDRDRHAQHAAGRARRRHDRVLLASSVDDDGERDRASSSSTTETDEDLHEAGRQAHGGLRDGTVRLMPMRIPFQEELDDARGDAQEEGELVLRALARRDRGRSRRATPSWPTR